MCFSNAKSQFQHFEIVYCFFVLYTITVYTWQQLQKYKEYSIIHTLLFILIQLTNLKQPCSTMTRRNLLP